MEAPVDHTAAPPHHPDLSPFAKGKRTKRLRPHSPLLQPLTSEEEAEGEEAEADAEEEVEIARCLILLSRGKSDQEITYPPPPPLKKHAASGGGVYVCKTCNRTFSSFQALGGHRTSHRKVKTEKRSSAAAAFSDDDDFPSSSRNSLSLQLSTVPRMHECAYCGAEFTSGQALGGHMRKHRAGPIAPRPSNDELELQESKRLRNGLSLDLNLPAPEDDNHRPRQIPVEKEEAETVLSLSTVPPPPLIDCQN